MFNLYIHHKMSGHVFVSRHYFMMVAIIKSYLDNLKIIKHNYLYVN